MHSSVEYFCPYSVKLSLSSLNDFFVKFPMLFAKWGIPQFRGAFSKLVHDKKFGPGSRFDRTSHLLRLSGFDVCQIFFFWKFIFFDINILFTQVN